MEILGENAHIDEFLLLALVFCTTGLILEHYIVIPAPLDGEVLLVKERIPERDVSYSVVLFGFQTLLFLYFIVSSDDNSGE